MMIFGWKFSNEHGFEGQVIPVRFDPEFMQSLRTIRYEDYRLRIVQTVDLSAEEIEMPLEDLAEKYPFRRVRRSVFA